MNRRVLFLVATVCSVICAVFGSSGVFATDITSTNFLLDSPLLITGYAWQESTFSYIQLYNNSDSVQHLNDWQYFVQDAAGDRTQFVMTTVSSDAIAPHTHVIASYAGAVAGASLVLSAVPVPSLTQSVKAKLVVAPAAEGVYRETEYSIASGSNTVWQRNFSSTGQGYVSSFSGSTSFPDSLFDDGFYELPSTPGLQIVEIYPYSSDCAPDDTSPLCGDYIKLKLDNQTTDYSRYVLRTDSNSSSRTISNTFYLAEYPVSDDGYITVAVDENGKKLSITNSGGYVWLEDLYGTILYSSSIRHYESASNDEQGLSWALSSDDTWQWTTTPQPGLPNLITKQVQQVKTCPAGKYLNPDTGRCRTIEEAVNALAACAEGQYRNPATNRCKQVASTVSALKPCGEGQERNPATNRCRSIVSAVAELIPCQEGYERNPATNRCRKVTGALASAGVGGVSEDDMANTSNPLTMWGWALALIAGSGAVGYGVYEWRHEIHAGWKSLRTRSGRK